MSIRLVAIDLDGTLLNSRGEVSPASQAALAEAFRRGVQIVVVTGRRARSAGRLVRQIPCPVTLMASNGALVQSNSGEVLHRSHLPAPVAREVLEVAKDYRPYAVAIFDRPKTGQVVMEENASREGPVAWYLRDDPECLSQVPDLAAALTADPLQIMFGGPPARLEPLEPLLRGSPVGSRVHLTWTKYPARNVCLLDVMAPGCSKGAALEKWSKECGVLPEEVMAIGDNFNDLEMLRFAGFPVVMGNGSAGLAREGWWVTDSNDQDGVAAALDRHVFRPGSAGVSPATTADR